MEDEDSQRFTALSGELSYTGCGGISISFSGGDYTLNGEPMGTNKAYDINHGDVIRDLNFKAPSSDDLKWEFT